MIKITFYPNDEARIVGGWTESEFARKRNCMVNHNEAEEFKNTLAEQSRDGTIEAQIVTIRKPGAYTIPKLDRVNDVFGMIDYLYG